MKRRQLAYRSLILLLLSLAAVAVLVVSLVVDLGAGDSLASVVSALVAIGTAYVAIKSNSGPDAAVKYSTPPEVEVRRYVEAVVREVKYRESTSTFEMAKNLGVRKQLPARWRLKRPLSDVPFYDRAPIEGRVFSQLKKLELTVQESFMSTWLAAEGALLVEGTAGIGKSRLLTIVVKQLIEQRRDGENLPVLLSLLAYDYTLTFEDGIRSYISVMYRMDPNAASLWVESGKIDLILDGADEVPYMRLASFIRALLSFTEKNLHARFLLAARPETLLDMEEVVGAIPRVEMVHPEIAEVQNYVNQTGRNYQLARQLAVDREVGSVAGIPLFINAAIASFPDENDLRENNPELTPRNIVTAYVDRILIDAASGLNISVESLRKYFSWLITELEPKSAGPTDASSLRFEERRRRRLYFIWDAYDLSMLVDSRVERSISMGIATLGGILIGLCTYGVMVLISGPSTLTTFACTAIVTILASLVYGYITRDFRVMQDSPEFVTQNKWVLKEVDLFRAVLTVVATLISSVAFFVVGIIGSSMASPYVIPLLRAIIGIVYFTFLYALFVSVEKVSDTSRVDPVVNRTYDIKALGMSCAAGFPIAGLLQFGLIEPVLTTYYRLPPSRRERVPLVGVLVEELQQGLLLSHLASLPLVRLALLGTAISLGFFVFYLLFVRIVLFTSRLVKLALVKEGSIPADLVAHLDAVANYLIHSALILRTGIHGRVAHVLIQQHYRSGE